MIHYKYAVKLAIDYYDDEFNVPDRYFVMLKEHVVQIRSSILIFEEDESFLAFDFELLADDLVYFTHAIVFAEDFILTLKREISLSWPSLTRILIEILHVIKNNVRLDLDIEQK